nr:putative capsid [Marmot picobirnavirus]
MAKQARNATNQTAREQSANSGRSKNARTSQSKKRKAGSKNRYYTKAVDNQQDPVKERIQSDGRRVATANDVGWYSNNPELLRSAGSVPFASILGAPYGTAGKAVPGIMRIMWDPSFGAGDKPIAINQAADSMYSYVVHANSRNYSYTAPDLMILTIAGMQVFSMLASMIRAYGIVKYYTESNRYSPDSLLVAMGFKPENFRDNLSQIWFDINNMINMSKQVWVPNKFPLLERWFWLNSNVFKDAEGERGQLYVPVQTHYLQYNEMMLQTGGCLTPLQHPTNGNGAFQPGPSLYDWSTWKRAFENLLTSLIDSEDRGIIYGDLLNAYGPEQLYALPQIDANYAIEPVYSAEVLTQIENLTVHCVTTVGLVQREEDLYPLWDEASIVWPIPGTSILNFHTVTQPTPEMVMVATRLASIGYQRGHCFSVKSPSQSDLNDLIEKVQNDTRSDIPIPMACGSEIVWRVETIQIVSGSRTFGSFNPVMYSGDNLPQAAGDLMAFDWHPFLYRVRDESEITPPENKDWTWFPQGALISGLLSEAYGDFDNYTELDAATLQKLHDVAMYSLFGVPHI